MRKGSFWCRRIVCVTVVDSSCDWRKAGSVCETSSSVFFSEGFPCGMSVTEDAREVSFCC